MRKFWRFVNIGMGYSFPLILMACCISYANAEDLVGKVRDATQITQVMAERGVMLTISGVFTLTWISMMTYLFWGLPRQNKALFADIEEKHEKQILKITEATDRMVSKYTDAIETMVNQVYRHFEPNSLDTSKDCKSSKE